METEGLTAEELLHISDPAHRFELVRGRLVVREPAGFTHGRVGMAVAVELGQYVKRHRLGVVLAADTGYVLQRGPDTVRAPDVSFVSRGRIPDPEPSSYAELAPDLAVEVLSPSNTQSEIAERIEDLFAAGTRLVWVLDPKTGVTRVHRADGTTDTLAADGVLDGEDVVPGFRCSLREIFTPRR
jgi:Uma2 family endonuclease